MALLFVGCTVVDIIFPGVRRLPRWPAHTEFTRRNLELVTAPPLVTIGGNGANAAYVAARCGAVSILRSNLGQDEFGRIARTWLVEAGCRIAPVSGARRTAVNVTANNPQQQRATLFYPGTAPGLPATLPPRGQVSHTLVCGWPHPPLPVLARRMKSWRAAGIQTAFDAGPILGSAPKLSALAPVLAALDLFLANEHEVCAITRRPDLAGALACLRRHFSGHVVIKLGPRGAVWMPAGAPALHPIPGRNVTAVSTVGAGDTFNGALLVALSRGKQYPAALRLANLAAASVVRSAGGVLGLRVPAGLQI